MNGINRRGQKVVCVLEVEFTSNLNHRVYDGPEPVLNSVYTVVDFVDNTGVVGSSDPALKGADITAGVELLEIPTPKSPKSRRVVGWPIVCFRPVDERKTDISDLVRQPTYDEMREIIRETHRQIEDA